MEAMLSYMGVRAAAEPGVLATEEAKWEGGFSPGEQRQTGNTVRIRKRAKMNKQKNKASLVSHLCQRSEGRGKKKFKSWRPA